MKNYFVCLLLFVCGISQAQKGKQFPQMSTETLKEQTIIIPEETMGKFTLIGLAYSKKAEDDLKSWQIPTYNKFIAKTGMMDAMYDVNLYFVPMFTGAKKVAKGKAMKELDKEADSRIKSNVLFYAGELDSIKEELNMSEKDNPYFFMLDKQGKIIWSAHGRFRQEYFDQIEAILTQ